MLTLAFDTATLNGRFALAENGQLLEYRPLNVSGSYADALLVVVNEMLTAAGKDRRDLRRVAVTTGPGSFTGVRIGVATGKGLAWGLGCELFGVTSLEAMAAALLAEHSEATWAVPVLDARRGEVFAGVYKRSGSWVECCVSPSARKPDAWWEHLLLTLDDPNSPAYGGDGTGILLGQGETLRPELAQQGMPQVRPWTSSHPATAPALAVAASAGADLLAPVHPFAMVPSYLRGSDAEVKRQLNLTPKIPGTDISIHQSRKDAP
jgi:tRNA threonylcarbamoyladenosine biosynthesis protein TsaB|nr:tRNA (adenosine(37)-N6)-threonylcarbamoyltransferase complex dimerization subunit type 1 TsaB [Candidatus Krumholzibacteria bacterium]